MLKITKLSCGGFDLDHLDIFWEIEDFDSSAENIMRYEYRITRSESHYGPFVPISPALKDIYWFRDTAPALLHKWRQLFYQVVVKDTVTSEEKVFGPVKQESDPDLIAMEIQRQEDMLFRNFVGRKCWLYPVRTFGPKCTCYDTVTSRRTKSNHLPCFDTGYLGGYLAPVECFIQFDPAANNPSGTPMGEQQTTNTSIRLLSFPPVKPKDIVVEAENRRWKIVTVTQTERLRFAVHQEITAHEVPKGDIEYKLPVNVEFPTLVTTDERNFTNPQHQDRYGSIDDIMAVYGYRPRGGI
jgi:hypothetical protein